MFSTNNLVNPGNQIKKIPQNNTFASNNRGTNISFDNRPKQ